MPKTKKDNKEKTTVTRISASDSKKTKPAAAKKATKATKVAKKADKPKKVANSVKMEAFKRGETETNRNPLKATARYFRGAWHELKQVRWPTRGATWSLTGAVIAFTTFFVIFILIADAAFKYLFEIILK